MRKINNLLLIYKAILYRILSISIFTILFGYGSALFIGAISLLTYYLYDLIFHRFFKIRKEIIQRQGCTILLTGYSGAGKSTIAQSLRRYFIKKDINCVVLDGDIIREGLCKDLGFSQDDRQKNIERIAWVAQLLSNFGLIVICPVIAPKREVRENFKKIIKNFVEIYVKCPIDVCEKRDVKGLYAKVRKGEIKNFTGIDSIYEEPLRPDCICNTDKEELDTCVSNIVWVLQKRRRKWQI